MLSIQVDQNDAGSPLRDVTEAQLRSHGHCYEILALLSFTDNRTSRTVEVSKRCGFTSPRVSQDGMDILYGNVLWFLHTSADVCGGNSYAHHIYRGQYSCTSLRILMACARSREAHSLVRRASTSV